MNAPLSTYRVQLNKKFTFKDLNETIDYLHELGISWIYASPVLAALPGSDHGYDVTDPFNIHAETGSIHEVRFLSAKLKRKGMGWLQDIVPNHMALSAHNILLMDVLERFRRSPYFSLFDIDWEHPDDRLQYKLMLPFLSQHLKKAMATGEIKLEYSETQGIVVCHSANAYATSIESTLLVSKIFKTGGQFNAIVEKYLDAAIKNTDLKNWKQAKAEILSEINSNPRLKTEIKDYIERINSNLLLLEEFLSAQNYSFTHWKDACKVINYRRFFTINVLICLVMEDADNFKMFHRLLISMYKKNYIQGFRIDHIDGLGDPAGYIDLLRRATDNDCYIIAEKILGGKEILPETWHLQGTTGYDFVSVMNKLVTDIQGFEELQDFYKFLLPDLASYEEMVYQSKMQMLKNYMRGELDNLCRIFCGIDNETALLNVDDVRETLALFMCSLPVYRLYPDRLPLDAASKKVIEETFDVCEKRLTDLSPAFKYLQKICREPSDIPARKKKKLDFIKRMMQFTGPLTAKGVEDTAFYIYHPLISHNEVGDSPSIQARSVEWFHEQMLTRLQLQPMSINAGSTHDTKRGEDARMRLNVLSEFTEQWKELVLLWMDFNKRYHVALNKTSAPTVNDEYFIYQSLLGSYTESSAGGEFKERFSNYIIKGIREAKLHSTWEDNNEDYEQACLNFINQILTPGSDFLNHFIPFKRQICRYAYVYSSIQALIKITAPGIPDIYQGSELLDLSFVDPDNRRPVDFEFRKLTLLKIKSKLKEGKIKTISFVINNRSQGFEKFYVTHMALHCRMEFPRVFYKGDYLPLYNRESNYPIVAYCRLFRNRWIIVLAALKLSQLLDENGLIIPGSFHGHAISIPTEAPTEWENILTGEKVKADGEIQLKDVFRQVPFALLKNL